MTKLSTSEKRKISLGFILGWTMGGLLIISGLLALISKPGYGFILILSGLSIFPPFWEKIKQRFNIKLSGILKIVIFLLLIGFSGSFNIPTVQNVAPGTSATQPDSVSFNQAIQDGDLVFTVTAFSKSQTLGNNYLLWTQRNSQGEFYVITLQIANKGTKTTTFDSSMAQVIDAGGNTYSNSNDGQAALGWQTGKYDLFFTQIQPQLSYTGLIVFDLPSTIQNPTLLVKGSYFSQGKKIRLY